MDRRAFVVRTGGVLLGLSFNLRAQGTPTTRRIGLLSAYPRATVAAFLSELRPELDKLGWTDGRNIAVLVRTTDGEGNERLPSLAGELVSQGPDLILVQTAPAARALMQATKSLPIVLIGVGNPVEYGIVADFAKPGGNVTGSSYLANEFANKLLQLLKEAAPRLQSVALFVNRTNEHAASFAKYLKADAAALGMRLQVVEIAGQGDLEAAFALIRHAKTESILLPPEPLILSNRDAIADFAQTHGLPLAVVGTGNSLPASGLIAYGPTSLEYAQLTARYVDRILKGAKPADLPVEQPAKFELAISLKTAKTLGLRIPQSLLYRADAVIQ